jgi:hypothetical protein
MTVAQSYMPKVSIEEVVKRIFTFRQITRLDQRLLMTAFMSQGSLSENEHLQINQVFDALQKGFLRVVD